MSYERKNTGKRPMVLEPDGRISRGAAGRERRWELDAGQIALIGEDGKRTVTFKQHDKTRWLWHGTWAQNPHHKALLCVHRGQVIADIINTHSVKKMVEIGVWQGQASQVVLELCPHLTLLMVDMWRTFDVDITTDPMRKRPQAQFNSALLHAKRATDKFRGRRMIVVADQRMASELIEDQSLGLAFLDADHDREETRQALLHWIPKVHPGGVVCGHDYKTPHFTCGVDEAVQDVAGALGATITEHPDSMFSFVIPEG